MSRRTIVLLGSAWVAILVAGCGDFRQRTADAQAQIGNALAKAETAEQAAARNTGRLLHLEQRVSDLEAALAALEAEDVPQ